MLLRYEDADDQVMSLLNRIVARSFTELTNAKIKVIFDLKKRKSGGHMVLGRIMKTNDLLRHLTRDEVEILEGYDYIISLDKMCWESIDEADRIRIIRHELRHTYVDLESEASPYRLQNHSILDFYEEVELNKDDPRWRERVADLASSIYEQKKDEVTDEKGFKRTKKGRAY
jgi:hypothetical protein